MKGIYLLAPMAGLEMKVEEAVEDEIEVEDPLAVATEYRRQNYKHVKELPLNMFVKYNGVQVIKRGKSSTSSLL